MFNLAWGINRWIMFLVLCWNVRLALVWVIKNSLVSVISKKNFKHLPFFKNIKSRLNWCGCKDEGRISACSNQNIYARLFCSTPMSLSMSALCILIKTIPICPWLCFLDLSIQCEEHPDTFVWSLARVLPAWQVSTSRPVSTSASQLL